jgi:hypothetical protein
MSSYENNIKNMDMENLDRLLDHEMKFDMPAESKSKIYNRVMAGITQTQKRTKRQHKWAAPLAACLAAAVIVVAAVPDARAAIKNAFDSVLQYMTTDPSARPEVDGIVVQKPAESKEQTVIAATDSRTDMNLELYEKQYPNDWLQEVGAVTINEAMYDGEKLYLKYTVDGSAVGLIIPMSDEFEKLYNQMPAGSKKSFPSIAGSRILVEGKMSDPGYSAPHTALSENGIVTVTVEYSGASLKGLSGEKQLTLVLDMADMLVDKDKGYGGEFNQDGQINVPFEIDADNKMEAAVSQKTYTIDGHKFEIQEANIKPTEIAIDFIWLDSQNDSSVLEYDFKAYLDGEEIKSNQPDGSFMDFVANSGPNQEYIGRLAIPFPKQGCKELKLVPYNSSKTFEDQAINIQLN